MKTLALLFLCSVSFADCDIPGALKDLRPGAVWSVRDTTIEWLDKNQAQPTDQEIATDIANCQNQKVITDGQKKAAKVTLKNPAATDADKLNAVITILDLAK